MTLVHLIKNNTSFLEQKSNTLNYRSFIQKIIWFIFLSITWNHGYIGRTYSCAETASALIFQSKIFGVLFGSEPYSSIPNVQNTESTSSSPLTGPGKSRHHFPASLPDDGLGGPLSCLPPLFWPLHSRQFVPLILSSLLKPSLYLGNQTILLPAQEPCGHFVANKI